jgi:hypothetical protein
MFKSLAFGVLAHFTWMKRLFPSTAHAIAVFIFRKCLYNTLCSIIIFATSNTAILFQARNLIRNQYGNYLQTGLEEAVIEKIKGVLGRMSFKLNWVSIPDHQASRKTYKTFGQPQRFLHQTWRSFWQGRCDR